MVVAIGSMAVKAVFNGAGLLAGLGSTSNKLKDVQHHSKSTTTEMKRMKSGAHQLRNALAAIGVGGFSALLMTTPQLTGSLAKIKYEMMQLAWSVGKHLKPSLDAVATILQGIRTGDWSTVLRGVEDLATSLLTLADKAISVTVDTIFGEGTADKAKTDFNNWIKSLEDAWANRDLPKLLEVGIWEPLKWVGEKIGDLQRGEGLEERKEKTGAKMRGMIATIPDWLRSIGDLQRSGLDDVKGSYQLGGYIPQTGLYQLHAGETVTMKGSTGRSGGSSNITLDFSGANINLASGIELEDFADSISKKIAEKQQSLTY